MQSDSSAPAAPSETVDILVKEARNIPKKITERMHIKHGEPIFVVIVYGNTIKRTRISISDKGTAKWNEELIGITLTQSTPLKFEIYSQKSKSEQTLIGQCDIPAEQLRSLSGQDHTLDINYTGCPVSSRKTIELDLSISPHKSQSSVDTTDAPLSGAPVKPKSSPDPSESQAARTGDAVSPVLPTSQSVEEAVDRMGPTPRLASVVVDGTQIGTDAVGPITDQYDTWELLLERVKFVVDVVDKIAQIHPYASMAWAIISVIPKVMGQQMERDAQVKELVKDLNDGFKTLREAQDLQDRCADSDQAEIVSRIMQQTSECGTFIKSYAKDSNFWKRLVKNVAGGSDKLVDRYRTALAGLRREFVERTAVTTKICVLQVTDSVERVSSQIAELDAMIVLKDIPYGEGARFDPARRCLPRTRIGFLDEIQSWVRHPDSPQLLVLFGQAGTGKSTIASEIARRFDEDGQLMSSFVFDRAVARPPHLPITTLARDLSDNCTPYKRALVASIRGATSFSLGTRDCATLFQRLLIDQLVKFDFIGNPLVVIDALDECGDEHQRSSLVTALASGVSKFPGNFRVLVTARAERDLEKAFEKASSVRIIRMDDEKLGAETEVDIRQYIHFHLTKYLSDSDCWHIARIAGRLFQWASVACEFIIDPPRGKRRSECIGLIMSSAIHEPQMQLDKLYFDVLGSIFPSISQDNIVRSRYKTVMGLMLAPFEPFSQDSLISLGKFTPPDFQVDAEDIQAVIDGMGSLLSNVTIAQSASPVVPLHTSFRDFLTSEHRSGSFFVDLSVPHNALARSCLRLMLDPAEGVRFNICRLPTSYQENSDIPDLKSLIEKHLPPVLSYACRYWDDHLEQVTFSEDIFLLIQKLFKEKLLFWFEALSLTGSVSLATSALSSLQEWLSRASDYSPEDLSILNVLVEDSISFLRAFGDVIAHHAAHIYLSALPFCPLSSAIYETYQNLFEHSLKVVRGQSHRWEEAQHSTTEQADKGLTGYLYPIAFSSDGKTIAFISNSEDNVQLLQDGTVDRALSKALVGRGDEILCAAFSLDGSRLATGFNDRMVRVWDAATGNDLFGPLEGHQNPISSVVFSSDGTLLASADYRSIRSWNTSTGAPAELPVAVVPETSRLWPSPLAYSPDNQCIAIGTSDSRIRVWDVNTGRAILEPLQGHTRPVYSIAFSPNGDRIASGDSNGTVRIWDAKTGLPATEPCTGHTSWVTAVAFSPDSSRIISGSIDHSVRVWDAATGELIAGPFGRYTRPVVFVAFSPSGDHIISGSDDGVIRTTSLAASAQPSLIRILDTRTFSKDGWVKGPNSEFMFWVPEQLRKGLFFPSTISVWGAGVKAIEVDYSSFVHGDRWAECYTAGIDGWERDEGRAARACTDAKTVVSDSEGRWARDGRADMRKGGTKR